LLKGSLGQAHQRWMPTSLRNVSTWLVLSALSPTLRTTNRQRSRAPRASCGSKARNVKRTQLCRPSQFEVKRSGVTDKAVITCRALAGAASARRRTPSRESASTVARSGRDARTGGPSLSGGSGGSAHTGDRGGSAVHPFGQVPTPDLVERRTPRGPSGSAG